MPNVTGDNLTFNIDSVQNNQILVYNAATGVFVAQDSLSTDANAAIVGAGNVGASGVGVFSAKDGTQLKFKKIVGSGATSVTESANVITVSSTAFTLPSTLQTTATNANSFVYRGRNFGDNANVDAFAGVFNNANFPIHSQSSGFDAKTRFIIGSNDATDIELKSQHSLLLSTNSSTGHIEVRSANSTVFYTGSSSSTTPALKINSNRSLTVANAFTLPTADGTANQVLKTDGSGSVSWTSINADGVTPAQLTANLANYIPKNASSTPDVTGAYDIGSSSKQYLNIYASNFKGTSDFALRVGTSGSNLDYATLANMANKTLNLSDLSDASAARTNLSVYSKAQVDANISSAQLQNAISQINTVGSANTINANSATSSIRFEGGTGIALNQYSSNNTIQISKSDAITGVFKNFNFNGTVLVPETNQDTINFTPGANISFSANPGSDSVTIDATLDDASIDKYTKGQVNTLLSANVSALRFYKTITGDSGSTAASAKDDSFAITGGTGISTVVGSDAVTINTDGVVTNAFKNIQVAGQNTIVAEQMEDTLTFVAGSGITLTTDQSADSITITNSGGGGSGAAEAFKTIAVTGSNSIVAASATDTLTFTAGANATITSSGSTITIDATGTGSGVKGQKGEAGSNGSAGDKGQKGEVGDAGATGPAGPQGTAGSSGATGPAGDKGQKGDQGTQGSQGTAGDKGATGATGPQGAQGPAGDKGQKGELGAQGPGGSAGSAGATGDKGQKGEVGVTGPAGPQGNVGNTGPAGSNGSDGDKGAKGEPSTVAGPTGPAGGTGPAGDKGEPGVAGPQGPAGSNGSNGDKGQKGELGPQGPTGPQGAQGDTGAVGPQGLQGTTGATGPVGPQGNVGAQGPTGDKGQKGELGGPTGPTGDKGQKGEVGAQGNVGPAGSNGSDGDKGEKGAASSVAGPTGPTGPAGGTGPAGSAGDKGQKGEVGSQGATGPAGSAGSAGAAGDKGQKGEAGGGGGGSGAAIERLKLNYNTSGDLASISDTTSGIQATTITSASGAEVEIQFTGFSYPPGAIMAYGYNYSQNKYNFNAVSGDWTTRSIDGGGSQGSPNAFGSFSNIDLKVSEAITGASRTFGQSTHAWLTFIMAD